jgi:hypothetical protein
MRSARSLGRIVGAGVALAMVAGALGVASPAARASSHREAPLISNDPQADNTDLYAFVSPDKPDTVTIVANYIPLEEPAGGPNFHSFGDDVRYEIHVDNDGDARPDLTYRFTFKTKVQNPETFLYITGPVTSPTDPNFNLQQSYKVQLIEYDDDDDDDEETTTLGSGNVPPVNVGPRSTPNYESIAAQAVAQLERGTTVFAGPRDDAFFVDLGSIFDLGGLRPFNNLHLIPLDPAQFGDQGIDGVSGYNTHTITLQVPISELTRDQKGASETKSPVLGIYASASRQSTRVLRSNGKVQYRGSWVQVSRLGNPLINEVIIPLGQKDYWNAEPPADDAQFRKYYEKPELAGIINLLYGGALEDVDTMGRADLSAILLTGVKLPDGSAFTFTGRRPADLLRLNVAVAPTAAVGAGDPLGVLAGDLAGFPNGRRLEDDVTDIELKAVAQGYGDVLAGLLGLPNKSPNNLVGDGVDANDLPFLPAFPYQASPHSGYDSTLHGGMRTPFGP